MNKMQKYTLNQGDLGNGFSLNKNLEGTMGLIPSSMGRIALYRVRISGHDFESGECSPNLGLDPVNELKNKIVNKYLSLERIRKTEQLSSEEESLRRELSDLLTRNNERGESK